MARLMPKIISPEEYLELEKAAEVRHEFVDGIMYAMSGASRNHNLIGGDIFFAFKAMARGKSCRIYQNDMKLQFGSDYYYPDVMVVCAPEPDNDYFETSPCILVEVLSDSTQGTDLREKAVVYRQIKSLQTYLIVDPNSKYVRHYHRDDLGNWEQEILENEGEIKLPCLEGSIHMNEIYQGISL